MVFAGYGGAGLAAKKKKKKLLLGMPGYSAQQGVEGVKYGGIAKKPGGSDKPKEEIPGVVKPEADAKQKSSNIIQKALEAVGVTYEHGKLGVFGAKPEPTPDFTKEEMRQRSAEAIERLKDPNYWAESIPSAIAAAEPGPFGEIALGMGAMKVGGGVVPKLFGPGATKFITRTVVPTGEKGISQALVNTKTVHTAKSLLAKAFSTKALVVLGGLATTTFFGMWGQAEAGEPLSISMRNALDQAEQTGDWSVYEEAKQARLEITNLPTWQKILLWTPASVFVGIPNKLRGIIEGGRVLDKVAELEQKRQAEGTDEKSYYANIRKEQHEMELAEIDYFNEQRILTEKAILELKDEYSQCQGGNESAYVAGSKKDSLIELKKRIKLWEEYQKRIQKNKTSQMRATAKFWTNVTQELMSMRNRSRLGFGLGLGQ